MIVPMKKITLVVLDGEREQALTALRKTGVLHIEKREAASQSISDLHTLISKLDNASSILLENKDPKKKIVQKKLNRDETLQVIERVFACRDELRLTRETIVRLSNELDRLALWGDVHPSDFSYLADKGIYLFPYEMSSADYATISESVRTIVVNRDKKSVRCLVWGEKPFFDAVLPSSARSLALPVSSSTSMKDELSVAQKLLPTFAGRFASEAEYSDSILALKTEVLKELEFETTLKGMPLISLGEDGAHVESTSLAWLTGFVPVHEELTLSSAAKMHGWAFMSDDPADEDNVPTHIKNNRFVNLISPLLDFLGTVPGYRELDISLWFLLFFGVFFAMIFGDGGYGALLVLLSLFGIISASTKKKPVSTGLYMFLYLGLMTVAWGTVTCTWFGLPVDKVPEFLKSVALPAFSNANPDSPNNIKVFCFTLGLIQISLAHVIGMIRNRKTIKVLGELGALLMTVGMYFVVLNLVVDADKYPLSNIILGLIGAGFLLNFLFINYSGSVGGGIVESLKNSITMFLGVVNMFGDIMSYIRLWAVGLAGSAISGTVNTMAGPMLGGFIIFAGIVLLFFGHGLNLVMNVLSVIVHGVRLNTLEFSNHLGLTWSGFKYEPFSETVKK